jgi:hypothetical protein
LSAAGIGAGTEINTREELINALQEAVQVEHGLMIQYLFAALSCKKRASEGLSEEEVEIVRQWEARILRIARDEMAHLATACNLITAIGGSPDFNRPNFPQVEHHWFPFGFHLQKLDTESLARFVRAESPKPAVDAMMAGIAPEPIEFDYVGELYGIISDGFRRLVPDIPGTNVPDPRLEARLFIGRPESQDDSDWSGGLSISSINGRQAAEAAIAFIVREGEGTPEGTAGSHFDIFSTIARELQQRIDANPSFAASRNVLKNPLTRAHEDADLGFNLIDPATQAHPVAELFNHVYATMLLLLMQFFDPAGETSEQRTTVRDTARRAMSGVVRPLAEVLTELPATSDPNGPTAGAPFELYGILKLPANPDARLAMIAERFSIAATETRRLAQPAHPTLKRLAFLARNLDLIVSTLTTARG